MTFQMSAGKKALSNNSYKQLFSLEAGCLVLELQKSIARKKKKKKVIFQGGNITFSQKKKKAQQKSPHSTSLHQPRGEL